VDRQNPTLLFRQLYEGLRAAILTQRLRAGSKLPSSRELAQELGVSRNTVTAAFEQLLTEGYVTMKRGSGTFVASEVPDELLRTSNNAVVLGKAKRTARTISQRATLLAQLPASAAELPHKPRAFQPGLCAIDEFPIETWARLTSRRLRRMPRTALDYHDAVGWQALRAVLAGYLSAARGVQCEAANIIIVAGSQHGLDLAARVLLTPGATAWIEDPGYTGARGALLGAGATLVPVPIDEQGIVVSKGAAGAPQARVVYVTPSHQFPLGVVMSLARRLELLEWAAGAGAWIIEDDYDAEFRYAGRPLAALQGLDRAHRVLYLGTFSKVLFPSLRLGYLVVPPDLVATFRAVLAHTAYHAPLLEQLVLTDFITEGHFARHLRRMRALYAERQDMLVAAAKKELAGLLDVQPNEAGMHLLGWLPKGSKDKRAFQQALAYNVYAPPLSFYCDRAKLRPGLLLGYTSVSNEEIRRGVRRLRQALATPQT
jgi:GntR family transcriptional regulator/MocR family aminotransferase